jgi:hypothetical protein
MQNAIVCSVSHYLTQWYLIGEIVEAQNCGGSYEQGKRDEARELLAPVYGWFTEG